MSLTNHSSLCYSTLIWYDHRDKDELRETAAKGGESIGGRPADTAYNPGNFANWWVTVTTDMAGIVQRLTAEKAEG